MRDERRDDGPRTLAQEFGLSPGQARAVFGAVRAVVEADGAPRERGQRLLEVAAATLAVGDWRGVPAASPAEVGEALASAGARRVLVDALMIPACIEGEVTGAGERAVRTFAAALGVRSHWVDVLGPLRRRRVFAVKRALAPRSPDARRLFRRTWQEDGIRGGWMVLRFLLGVYRDRALAARFRALGALPPGTFGRTFFDHLDGRGLTFPGEAGGIPERMIHHDLMHVVNEYSTEPEGECRLAGFYAGFADGDAFTFLVTVLATFQLGLPVSPAVVKPARGAFDPAQVVAAFLRGRRLQVDVMGRWDYWSLMPLPIEEVRERLGIAEPAAPSRRASA